MKNPFFRPQAKAHEVTLDTFQASGKTRKTAAAAWWVFNGASSDRDIVCDDCVNRALGGPDTTDDGFGMEDIPVERNEVTSGMRCSICQDLIAESFLRSGSRKTASTAPGYYLTGKSGNPVSGPYSTPSEALAAMDTTFASAVEYKSGVEDPQWDAYKPEEFPYGLNTVNGSRKVARSLSEIAGEIEDDWANVNYAARPYLDAMYALDSINDSYYADDAASVVAYFLSNASSWRGEKAKEIKAELKAMLKKVYGSRKTASHLDQEYEANDWAWDHADEFPPTCTCDWRNFDNPGPNYWDVVDWRQDSDIASQDRWSWANDSHYTVDTPIEMAWATIKCTQCGNSWGIEETWASGDDDY